MTDLYLGDPEDWLLQWDGEPRRCIVLNRPLLPSGRRGWRVRLEPPMPGLYGGEEHEVVLAEFGRGDLEIDAEPVRVRVCRIVQNNTGDFSAGGLSEDYAALATRDRRTL